MNTLLAAIALLAAQCCVLQCQSKKVINSRVEYMKYTVEQYQLGLISLSSIDGDRSEVGLVQNEFNANDTSPKDDTVVDTSSSVAGKRHVGPFDRTPLLSKVDDKQSRADDEENELSVDYKFNKTMGSYVIFHRTDDRAETDNVNESSSILTANSFDVTSSINAKHPSNSPTSKNSYCPTPYNPLKVDYVSGSLVEVNGFIFQCNDEPYTQYCNYPTFDETLFIELQADIEEATKLWLNAWVIIGECEKAVRPTLKPSTKPSREPSSSIIETPIYTPSWSPTTSPSWSPTATPTISTPNPSTKPSLSPLKAATSLPSISVTPTASPSVSPTANPSNSPTISPSYSPSTWSPTYYDDPVPDKCSKSQVRVRIELLTDGFPSDNSWVFKRKREKNGRRGALLMKSNEYEKVAQSDIREMCLDEGKYEFVLRDQYADGLCCENGSGQYKISAMSGSTNYQWELIAAGAEFVTSEVRHIFTVRKSGQVNVECEHPQRKIRIEVKTDNFGEDTSWQFRDASGVVIARNERTYGKRDIDTRDLCLDDESMYEFTVFDTYGDGMCCQFGQGAYRILSYSDELFREEGIASSDGVAILHGGGGMFYNISHPINTTTPELNVRDQNWLLAHNIRRKKYHAEYKKEYVPLQWSDGLKAEAQMWANSLLDSCGEGMYHDPSRIYGENAAGNTGRGSWGEKREPDQILTRFVEYELDDPWPRNGHLTQVLWRASRYVGCAEAHKVFGGGKQRQCHTQVCRYAVTGNCNMGRFQKINQENNKTVVDWLTPTLEDANFCGPLCPPDGCRA